MADYLKEIAQQAEQARSDVQTQQTQVAREISTEAERQRRELTEAGSEVETEAQRQLEAARKQETASKRAGRELGVTITRPSKEVVKQVEQARVETARKVQKGKKEVAEAKATAEAELQKSVEEALVSISEQEQAATKEYEEFAAENVELSTGEWIDRSAFEKLSSKDQNLIKELGVSEYSKVKEQEFKDNYIETGKEGEYIGKEAYADLSREDQKYLKTHSLKEYNVVLDGRAYMQYVDALTGEDGRLTSIPITRSEWSRLSANEKNDLVSYIQYTALEQSLHGGVGVMTFDEWKVLAPSVQSSVVTVLTYDQLSGAAEAVGYDLGITIQQWIKVDAEKRNEVISGLNTAMSTFTFNSLVEAGCEDVAGMTLAQWNSLSAKEQSNITGTFSRLQADNYYNQYVDIATQAGGTVFTREQWDKMEPESQEQWVNTALSEVLWQQYDNLSNATSGGHIGEIGFKSQPIDQQQGLVSSELEQFSKEYVQLHTVGLSVPDEWISRETFDAIEDKDEQTYLLNNGIEKWQSKYYVMLEATGELIRQDSFYTLPTEFQTILQTSGTKGLDAYIAENYVILQSGEIVPNDDYYNNYVATAEAVNAAGGNISILSRSEWGKLDDSNKEYNYNAQITNFGEYYHLLDTGEYIPEAGYKLLSTDDKKLINSLGVTGFNTQKTQEYISGLPQDAQDWIAKYGIDDFNKWLVKADGEKYGEARLAILKNIGVIPQALVSYASINDKGEIEYDISAFIADSPTEEMIQTLVVAGVDSDIVSDAQNYVDATDKMVDKITQTLAGGVGITEWTDRTLQQVLANQAESMGMLSGVSWTTSVKTFWENLSDADKRKLAGVVASDPNLGNLFAATVETYNIAYSKLPVIVQFAIPFIPFVGMPMMAAQLVSTTAAKATTGQEITPLEIAVDIAASALAVLSHTSVSIIKATGKVGKVAIKSVQVGAVGIFTTSLVVGWKDMTPTERILGVSITIAAVGALSGKTILKGLKSLAEKSGIKAMADTAKLLERLSNAVKAKNVQEIRNIATELKSNGEIVSKTNKAIGERIVSQAEYIKANALELARNNIEIPSESLSLLGKIDSELAGLKELPLSQRITYGKILKAASKIEAKAEPLVSKGLGKDVVKYARDIQTKALSIAKEPTAKATIKSLEKVAVQTSKVAKVTTVKQLTKLATEVGINAKKVKTVLEAKYVVGAKGVARIGEIALIESKVGTSIQEAIQQSVIKDEKFLESLSKTTRLTAKQLKKIEMLSGYKGLSSAVNKIYSAYDELKVVMQRLAEIKPATKLYADLSVKALELESNLAKAVAQYDRLAVIRYVSRMIDIPEASLAKQLDRLAAEAASKKELSEWFEQATQSRYAEDNWIKEVINTTVENEKALGAYYGRIETADMLNDIESYLGIDRASGDRGLIDAINDWLTESRGAPIKGSPAIATLEKPAVSMKLKGQPELSLSSEPIKGIVGVETTKIVPMEVAAPRGLGFAIPEVTKVIETWKSYSPNKAVLAIISDGLATTALATDAVSILPIIAGADAKVQTKFYQAVSPALATAIKECIAASPNTKASELVDVSAIARIETAAAVATQTTTGTATQAIVSAATEAAIKAVNKEATAAQIEQAVSQATKSQIKQLTSTSTKAKAQAMVNTITSTAVATTTAVAPTVQVKMATKAKVEKITTKDVGKKVEKITTKDVGKIEPIKPYIPIIIQLPDGSSHRLTKREFMGSVGWKQGFIYKMIFPPYGKNDASNTRKPIRGIPYYKGIGSAYASIVRLGGELPPEIMRDMGIFDIKITTGRVGKPKLTFKRDIKQKTKLTPQITAIRV